MSLSLLRIRFERVPDANPEPPFARFFFREDAALATGERDFVLGLSRLDANPVWEVWRTNGPVEVSNAGEVRLIESRDHLLAYTEAGAESVRQAGASVYAQLIEAIRARGFAHIVKAWNVIPDINGGSGNEERYRLFTLGRADIYDAASIAPDNPPAATAVGSPPGSRLQVYLLAARQAPLTLENPRQMAAWRYPAQYGPRSPSFSRAALAANRQLFLSGTAAIVGHESQHRGDAAAQAAETARNVAEVLRAACPAGAALSGVHVYVRQPDAGRAVLSELSALLPTPNDFAVVNADLCRSELLVEMDGMVTIGT